MNCDIPIGSPKCAHPASAQWPVLTSGGRRITCALCGEFVDKGGKPAFAVAWKCPNIASGACTSPGQQKSPVSDLCITCKQIADIRERDERELASASKRWWSSPHSSAAFASRDIRGDSTELPPLATFMPPGEAAQLAPYYGASGSSYGVADRALAADSIWD